MNISEINSVQDLIKANETKSNFQVAVEALENVHVLDNLKIIKWLVSNLADFHMEVGLRLRLRTPWLGSMMLVVFRLF